MKKIIAALCVSFMMMGPALAAPKTATASVPVKAQVVGNCSVTTNAALDFGTYDGTANKDALTTISISCTQSRSVDLSITGANTGDTTLTNTFNMVSAGNQLPFKLYSDAPNGGTGTPWKDMTAANSSAISVTKGTPASQDLYAEVLSGNDLPDGVYTDTLTITVAY